MPEIENYQVYNDRMRRSMWDKAFLMDKVPGAEIIIDYGCADGSLVRFLSALFPSVRFIGFDIDPLMVEAADARRGENTWFFSTMPEVLAQLKRMDARSERIAVNFSSVFHEIFHYGCDLISVRQLLDAVSPQYIVVRDMLYQCGDDRAQVSEAAERRVRERLPAELIRDFEACFGSIRFRRSLIHLLLKYRYTENWARECAENYFSCTWESLQQALDPAGLYRRTLFNPYILPWFRHTVETDFGINLGEGFTTHFAMILARSPAEKRIDLDEGGAYEQFAV